LSREGIVGGDCWGDLTNVQYKATQNCHNESPLYNEYILIKIEEKEVFFRNGSKRK
jgi:hypothetical protein